jgi:hypothetical protein
MPKAMFQLNNINGLMSMPQSVHVSHVPVFSSAPRTTAYAERTFSMCKMALLRKYTKL